MAEVLLKDPTRDFGLNFVSLVAKNLPLQLLLLMELVVIRALLTLGVPNLNSFLIHPAPTILVVCYIS